MKSLKIIFLISLSVVVLTGCSTIKNELGFASKAGITFNGLVITEADLDADLKAISDNKPLRESLKESGSPLVVDGKITPTYRASWANIQMQILAIREARKSKKMKITDKDRKQAEEEAKGLFAQEGTSEADEVWKAFSKSFRERLIEGYAEQSALLRAADKVTDKEIEEYFNQNKDIISKCDSGKETSHILLETREEAEKVKTELAAGKNFSDLAKEFSADPGSKDKGGELGCFVEGQFVEAFDNAAKNLANGTISDIIETEFGFHILKADAFSEPTLDEVKDGIIATLEPEKQSKLFDDVEKRLKKAKIKVSKKYGKIVEQDGIPSVVTLDTEDPEKTPTVPQPEEVNPEDVVTVPAT